MAKYLSKQDVIRAMKMTKSNLQASRYLGVDYTTYRKYSKLYYDKDGKTLFDVHKNQTAKGIPKMRSNKYNDEWLKRILSGEVYSPTYSLDEFKSKLIHQCILPEECNKCGFKEQRIYDYKVPIILNFIDKNKKNWKQDNLEFLCYNCYFLTVGDLYSGNKIKPKDNFENKEIEDEIWEMDDNMREHFISLGLLTEDESEKPGEEFRAYKK